MKFSASVIAMLAKPIAESLLKNYRERSDIDETVIPQDVEKILAGVNYLVNGNFVSAETFNEVFGNVISGKDISKGKMKSAFSALQKALNAVITDKDKKLKLDGVFGLFTWDRLANSPRCNGESQFHESTEKVSKALQSTLKKKGRLIRWWAPSGLPSIKDGGDAEELFSNAWGAWIETARIDVLKAKSEANANLLVTQAEIDSRVGGVLADANVGPIGSQVFTLRFDRVEAPWPAEKFSFTAMHEIGHLLGLTHASGSGDLMSPLYNPNVKGPTENDKQRLLALPGKPWKKQKSRPKPNRIRSKDSGGDLSDAA